MKQLPKIILLVLIFRLFSLTSSAQEDVASFIEDHPELVSLICIEGDETIVSHDPDERLTLASTGKIIILAEYARQVTSANLNPDEEISLEDVALYLIPGTDGNAHQQWLSTLGDDAETATLSQIVDSMIIFSSNAGADYILSRLEMAAFSELYDLLGLENTDLPTYFLGNLLVLSNHEIGITDLDDVTALNQETFLAEHDRLVDLFVNDADWREAELDFRDNPQIGLPAIDVQAQFFDRFSTQSTAADMLKVIQAPFIGEALDESTQAIMRGHLDWLFDINPANTDVYDFLATKAGSYAGIFTAVWYVDAIGFEPISLVIFYHDLPEDVWVNWITTGSYQSLEIAVVASAAACGVFAELLPDSQP